MLTSYEAKDLKEGIQLRYFYKDYGFLYKDHVKLSDEIFREGGICFGFVDGYCNLIQIIVEKDGLSYGTHVIVDIDGNIKLSVQNMLDYPYHIKGCVASIGSQYYNLKTGELILDVPGTVIYSRYYIFVGSAYSSGSDRVFKIDFRTGECETFT